MRRLLTTIISLHWTIVFGVLSGCAVSAYSPTWDAGVLHLIDLPETPLGATTTLASIAAAIALASVSAVFLWLFLLTLATQEQHAGDVERAARLAFGAATAILTLQLLAGLASSVDGHLARVAVQLGALLVSYIAICTEQRDAATREAPADVDLGLDMIRIKVAEAARMAQARRHGVIYPLPPRER